MAYRISDVAQAIDLANSVALTTQIRGWVKAEIIQLTAEPKEGVEADVPSSRPGSAALVSKNTAIRISAMVALVRLGISPSDAAAAAGSFSHGVTLDMTGGPPRGPGALFESGETSLIVWRDSDGALRRRVLNHEAADSFGFIRSRLGGSLPPAAPILILDCAAVLEPLAPLFTVSGAD